MTYFARSIQLQYVQRIRLFSEMQSVVLGRKNAKEGHNLTMQLNGVALVFLLGKSGAYSQCNKMMHKE
jgi:hypothetical protein